MIKAILFDIDGVLLNSFEANLRFYQHLFIKAGYPPLQKTSFQHMFHLTMYDVIQKHIASNDKHEIQRIWNMGKNRAVPYPDTFLSTPKHLKKIIISLSNAYKLAIVTSRIKNGIFTLPQLAPLKIYFTTSIGYEDTKNHKPYPDPLLLAAKRLNVKLNECIYIGDLPSDIEAATAAHMRIIILSKQIYPNATVCIRSFDELPNAIKQIT